MANKKILVVDDEPHLVQMVKRRLEANRYDVVTAKDGEEGLKKASSEKPDLIVLDVTMPTIDGFEMLKRLKSDDQTRSIPVIMLTASGRTNDIFEGQKLKATDYLIKPFEPDDLLKAIKRCI